MDTWGIVIFVIGLALYYITKKKNVIWIFISGLGAGILVGAIWAMQIISSVIP